MLDLSLRSLVYTHTHSLSPADAVREQQKGKHKSTALNHMYIIPDSYTKPISYCTISIICVLCVRTVGTVQMCVSECCIVFGMLMCVVVKSILI